jgi:type IV pilus assembly protein PilM
MAFFNKSKPLIGLDIGSSGIKAVELTKSKKGYELTVCLRAAGAGCRCGWRDHGCAGRGRASRETFLSGKFKLKGVATGVSGHSVIVKRVVVLAATRDEVESSIQLDAEQYIPFEITEVNLDYQVVGPGTTSSDEAGMEVVLVAAKKDKIQNHTNVISLAGRNPEIVDIDAFALQNAFEANYSVDPQATVALLNIGASLMNINIAKEACLCSSAMCRSAAISTPIFFKRNCS